MEEKTIENAKGPPKERYDCKTCCYRNRLANLCFPCLAKIIDELGIWKEDNDGKENSFEDFE